MYCNRCGNQVDPNSQFCITCGNAITPTVVPQSDNTVVPTNGTVVPTVVPQNNKSNVTITSIIVVLVIFIGAGIVGIMLLRNSKASVALPDQTTQIALADTTTTVAATEKTTKNASWATTTTVQRMDVIDNSYSLNGLKINIPTGYTPSYTNDVLTLIDPNGKDYYAVNVISSVYEAIDKDKYKNDLIKNGYDIHTFEPGTYTGRSGIYMTLKYSGYEYQCYVIKANSSKVAFFLFDRKASSEYIDTMINYSLM